MQAAAQEKILQTGNGIQLLGYYSPQKEIPPKGLVILLHGWEGSVDSTYIVCTGNALYCHGYDIFRLNFRDHGDSHYLNQGIFYAVLADEVFEAVSQIAAHAGARSVFLAGFSLGGNFVLRIIRKCAANPIDNLQHAVCISPVLDPEKATQKADNNFIIRKYFLKKWHQSLSKKQSLFPQIYDFSEVLSLKTIQAVTNALLEKYSNYNCSKKYFQDYTVVKKALLENPIPTTIITAKDDPIIPVEDFYQLELNDHTNLVIHSYGGHNGFLDGFRLQSWYEKKMVLLFNELSHRHSAH
jgi:hypothetical protein